MKPTASWTVADGDFLADLKEVIPHVILDANCLESYEILVPLYQEGRQVGMIGGDE